jgi:hypothetical protein
MRKVVILLFSLFFTTQFLAQEQAIKISSPNSEKEVIIKENKRIKIRTIEGDKISGRFRMLENNAIQIKDQIIALADIESIKRNPLFLSIFGTGLLIYGGALAVGMGAIIGIFIQPSGFLLAIPGAAMVYAGIKSPNVLRNYKAADNWGFEVITTSE